MPEKYIRHFLKTKESKDLLKEASERFKVDLEQIFKDKVSLEVIETESGGIYFAEEKPIFVRNRDIIHPTLSFKAFSDVAPRVVVDMGAVPYVCKGANIMAPGIRRYEGVFRKGDLVLITDEKHGKSIALGEIAYDLEEAKSIKQGIVVKNVHFVGDKVWNFIKELSTQL